MNDVRLTDQEIMDIWMYITGKADGLYEAGHESNAPLMFARELFATVSSRLKAKYEKRNKNN
jgi:hypothetical protein